MQFGVYEFIRNFRKRIRKAWVLVIAVAVVVVIVVGGFFFKNFRTLCIGNETH